MHTSQTGTESTPCNAYQQTHRCKRAQQATMHTATAKAQSAEHGHTHTKLTDHAKNAKYVVEEGINLQQAC